MKLFGTKEQKFLHCPRIKGERDKLKILPRDGTDWDSLSKSKTGCRTGWYQILTACSFQSRRTKWDRAEKDVLKQEKDILKTEKDVLKQER